MSTGVNRTVLTINDQFPGPLIRLNRGDTLLVNVTNRLPNATTIHWHGMFQNGTNWMDGTTGITQCPIPPGQNFLYNFTVQNQFGTYWYHAHAQVQSSDGIVGPLIVHAPEEVQMQQMYDFDQIVLLQDWYHDMSSSLLPGYLASGNENNEPVPDNGLIQGTNHFNCSSYGDGGDGYTCYDNSTMAVFSVERDKRYRLRFINTGAIAPFQVSVDNHTLQIIEADGTVVSPLTVHRFEISVAERYSVILTANQSSNTNYWLRAEMNTFCFGSNDVLDPEVLAVVTYTNTTTTPTDSVDWSDALDDVCQDLNNTLLSPATTEQAPPADVLYEISFSFEIGDYALDVARINGTSWTPNIEDPTLNQAITGLRASNNSFTTTGVSTAFSANQLVITLPTVQVVDFLVLNFDDGAHPFHLHGHLFWVMATSQDQYFPWNTDLYSQINSTSPNIYTTNPMRRDVLTINAYGWALIRFRSDNPGLWAFHCHILWHLEAGLLMQFMALPDVIKNWTLPSDVQALCQA